MPKISELTSATALTGTEQFAVVQSGTTKKATADQIATFIGSPEAATHFYVDIKADYGAVGDGVTPDDTAFGNFRTWAQSQSDARIILVIPPGEYLLQSFDTNRPFSGIRNLKVLAYRATLLGFIFGSTQGMPDNNTSSAYIASVAEGSTTVTLVTTSEHSRFAVGDWIYISAFDLQGFGSPPNHHFLEFKKITAINTGSGVITLDSALTRRYLSTYPEFNGGDALHPHCGGPARIYRLHSHWDCEHYIEGAYIPSDFDVRFLGRKCEFVNCHISSSGLAPTVSKQQVFRDCTIDGGIEVDKCIEELRFINCTIDQLEVQSSSCDRLVIDGCTFTSSIIGTGKNTVIRNSQGPSLKIGPTAYGIHETFYVENSRFVQVLYASQEIEIANVTTSNGSISDPISGNVPVSWLVPGGLGMYGTRGRVFKSLQHRQSGSDYVIDTTIPDTPTVPPSTTTYNRYPYQNVTVVNCTGCPEMVDLSRKPGRNARAYINKMYTSASSFFGDQFNITGNIEEIKVNVIRAYSGSQGTLTADFGHNLVREDNNSGSFTSIFTINLKLAGERTIALTGNSGSLSGDALIALTTNFWMVGVANQVSISADITAEAVDTWPIFTVEMKTDHGKIARDGAYAYQTFVN